MKRVQFEHSPIPYIFVLPQIVIIAVFFLWPAAQAVEQSFLLEDAFGLSSRFVWFRNYKDMILNDAWLQSAGFTLVFSTLVTFFSLAIALHVFIRLSSGQFAFGAHRRTSIPSLAPPAKSELPILLRASPR